MTESRTQSAYAVPSFLTLLCVGSAGSAQCDLAAEVELTEPLPVTGGHFGSAIDLDGDLMVVGSSGGLVDGGRVVVYRFDGAVWQHEETLVSENTVFAFGDAVAVDGDVIAVGAPLADFKSGQVSVFRHDGTSWGDETVIVPPQVDSQDQFGFSVALEGDWLVAGAPFEDCAGNPCGAAYAYRWDGASWVQEQRLQGTFTAEEDFGAAVSLDGGTLAISAPRFYSVLFNPGLGYVNLYRHDGAAWTKFDTVTDASLTNGSAFGLSVALSGPDLVVGCPRDDFGGFFNAGSTYFFEETSSILFQIANVAGPDPDDGDDYGHSADVDQLVAVVGAISADKQGLITGLATLERKQGLTGNWSRVATLFDPGLEQGVWFGSSVAVDGNVVAVGAPYTHVGGVADAGAVHVFEVPELVTNVAPTSAPGGSMVRVESCGGSPGTPGSILVTDIGGTPVQVPIFLGFWDVEGRASFTMTVPPGLGGLTADVVGYGFYLPFAVGVSDPVTFTFL